MGRVHEAVAGDVILHAAGNEAFRSNFASPFSPEIGGEGGCRPDEWADRA